MLFDVFLQFLGVFVFFIPRVFPLLSLQVPLPFSAVGIEFQLAVLYKISLLAPFQIFRAKISDVLPAAAHAVILRHAAPAVPVKHTDRCSAFQPFARTYRRHRITFG
ncbi:Uncharacterised protein [Neisseria meningitidis]|nr:Uncharacterised protein [Neisseria meningitidis]CWU09037.1 Uncharacterised protein [Neisseria meningitidis]CWU22591.1 Uncharacterised protein [Neisseria meningitidis]